MPAPDLVEGYYTLGEDVNKAHSVDPEPTSGDLSAPISELTLEESDEDLIDATKEWREAYRLYEQDVKSRQDECENYWLGKHYGPLWYNTNNGDKKRPLQDNLIFEAEETFLPEATRRNPEPVVTSDNTPEGNAIANDIKDGLIAEADRQVLKLKLRRMTRYWSLYFLGVLKISWDKDEDNIRTDAIRPQSLILDPEATISEDGRYTGGYIGQVRSKKIKKLIDEFPGKKDELEAKAAGKLGTKLTYIEWWTPEKLFWTADGIGVLDKSKNPHWNYPTAEQITDDYGDVIVRTDDGKNHFKSPRMPFIFLTYYNIGKHPHDDTGLIHQNLSNQDRVNANLRQINKNIANQNNGIALSGDHFTQEQAAQAATELSEGGALWVPSGDIRSAYVRDQAPSLPADVFNNLADTRNELRSIFGTTGISPQGIQSTDTARGKILVKSSDSSRIGGGITEQLEQVADAVFGWWIQMMLVYYDEPRTITVFGKAKSQRQITLSRGLIGLHPLNVTVREGSLIPKDALTQRNEAVDLWTANALDPIELYERLDFPDPYSSAEQLYLWQNAPQVLFPEAAARVAQLQAQMMPTVGPETASAPPTDTTAPPPENILSSVPIQ